MFEHPLIHRLIRTDANILKINLSLVMRVKKKEMNHNTMQAYCNSGSSIAESITSIQTRTAISENQDVLLDINPIQHIQCLQPSFDPNLNFTNNRGRGA